MTANRVYFAQHGLAADKTENPQRPLTEAGIKQTLSVAKQLHTSEAPVSQVFHSGKLRASQTADIFASTLNITPSSVLENLSPNDDVSVLAKNLAIENALYIGHLPHLEKLVSYLVTGNKDQNIIKFQNSAIICLEKNNDQYHIRWYLTPDLLK